MQLPFLQVFVFSLFLVTKAMPLETTNSNSVSAEADTSIAGNNLDARGGAHGSYSDEGQHRDVGGACHFAFFC